MLVLSRRPGEAVTIRVPPSTTETFVTVTVLPTDKKYPRLGLDGPAEVLFLRAELEEEACRQN